MPLSIKSRRNEQRLLRVNFNHGLARGMLDCIIFGPQGQNGLVNLVAGNGQPTPGTGSRNWRVTLDGAGLYVPTAATTTLSWSIPNHVNYSAGDVSARIRFVPVSFPHNFAAVYTKQDNVGNREIGLYLDSSGNQDFFSIGTANDSTVYTTNFAVGKVAEHVMTRSGSSITYYANGASIGTISLANTTAIAQPLSFGRDAAQTTQSGDFTYLSFQTWNRALSAAEALQLFQQPEAFLTPVVEPVYLALSVAPPILHAQILL